MTDLRAPTGNDSRLWPGIAAGLIVLSWLASVQVLWRCYLAGGQKWLQGDWLINLGAGPVRRGPLGQGLLLVSDMTGLAPLSVVLLVQLGLATLLFAVSAWLVLRHSQAALVPLVLSAGFFSVLWAADAVAGFRKEVLPLAAIALMVLPRAGLGRLSASAAMMALGAWGHEIGVLLMPGWLVVLVVLPPAVSRATLRGIVGLSCVLAGVAAVYAMLHPALDDTGPVCAEILRRQTLHPDFCNGAIAWLAEKGNGLVAVRYALAHGQNVHLLPLTIAAAFAPLAWLCWGLRRVHHLPLLIAVAIGPIFLLYPLALDWGRWVSVQVTVGSLVLLGLDAAGRLPAMRPPRNATCLAWLLVACLAGLTTMTEVEPNAILRRVIHGFSI